MIDGYSDSAQAAYDRELIAQVDPKEAFSRMGISMDRLEERIGGKFMVEGLIKHKTHVVNYGASGTGKTTITLHQCKEMIDNDPDIEKIYYFLLDGSDEIAYNAIRHINGQGERGKLVMVTDYRADEIMETLRMMIAAKDNLGGVVFVFDTYKKFQANINDKTSNIKHMHIMRELTGLGGTCISIAHTNKSGDRESGTAELEQDSDAIFRFDSMPDDDPNYMIVSIKPAGRVRWHPNPRSYRMPKHDPDISKVETIPYFDIEAYKPILENPDEVAFIRSFINDNPGATTHKIAQAAANETGASRREVSKILKAGLDRLWVYGGKRTNGRTYAPIIFE